MTQAIAGFNGEVTISTNGGSTYTKVGEMREATLTVAGNEIDATSFDSNGWEEYIPGLKSWEVETEQLFVFSDAGQTALYNALVNGATVKVRLLPKKGTGQTGYQGDAFITNWELGEPVDDAVTVAVSFRGTGALTTFVSA